MLEYEQAEKYHRTLKSRVQEIIRFEPTVDEIINILQDELLGSSEYKAILRSIYESILDDQ